MKTTRLLRVLSLFGILLLTAPFYDSCEGGSSTKVISTSLKEIEKPLFAKIFDPIVDKESLSGYEIASFFIYGIQEFNSFDEFKIEISKSFQEDDWYKNLGMFISIIFNIIVLISFSLAILVLCKKIKSVNKLALINVILIAITLVYIIFFESSFENISQIKWGYYAFIIVNVLIFFYSKKINKKRIS